MFDNRELGHRQANIVTYRHFTNKYFLQTLFTETFFKRVRRLTRNSALIGFVARVGSDVLLEVR